MKPIAVAVAIIVGVIVLSLALSTGTSESKNRKIAAELVELQRQWDTNRQIPALYRSLTNLPFHNGSVLIQQGSVSRRYKWLGMGFEQYYFIYQPPAATNTPDWTLYHAWYWYQPGHGKRELMMRRLATINAE